MIDLSKPEQLLHAEMCSTADTVAKLSGSDVSLSIMRMLDAMAAMYALDLINCPPEDFRFRQALMQQTMALRRVVRGEDGASPRI